MIPLDNGWQQIVSEGIEPLETYLETGVAPYMVPTSSTATKVITEDTEMTDTHRAISSPKKKASIFKHQRYMALYSLVYNMSTQRTEQNYSNQLYDKHGQAMEKYVKQKVAPSLQGKTGIELLRAMRFRWENHVTYNNWMEKIFTYLDRYFVRAYAKPPLKKRGLEIFYTHVFVEQDAAVRAELLNLIDQERDGKKIDGILARSLVQMYIGLGVDSLDLYQKHFELHLLPATQSYYQTKATLWLATHTFSEYLIKVENSLEEEKRRSDNYLHETTFPKLAAVVQKTLLTDRMSELLSTDTGILFLLQEERREDLQRLYRLFGLLDNGFEPIAEEFRLHVITRGTALVEQHGSALNAEIADKDPKTAKSIVQKQLTNLSIAQDFLNLHDHFKEFSFVCFKHELPFQRALKEAFEEFMNKNIGSHTQAAFLSTFCDQLLRSRSPSTADDSIEQTLAKVVGLFTYLTDKDMFADIYRNQLARRLLTETSTSTDAEKVMISKLKLTCGAQFTSRLEGMLNDLTTASDVQKEFKAKMLNSNLPVGSLLRDNYSVMVLTSAPEVNLPPEMQNCIQAFSDYYINEKTSHRKLSWVHHLGTVVITFRLPNGRVYDIQCNTFQACLLLLFNNERILSVSIIRDALGLEELLVKKLIACFNVARVLMKSKSGIADEYEVNENLLSKHRLIKIPVPVQEEAHNKDKVEEDRSIAVEAAIVRIMKARKQLKHTNLVVEVLNHLTLFKPNPRLIKTKIEALIERDFLARSPDDHQLYSYVA